MDISQIVTESVTGALITIFTALVGYLVHYGALYLKNLLLKYKAGEYVRAAEQLFAHGVNDKKFEYAAEKVTEFASKNLHLKLDSTQIQSLIEATVNEFCSSVKKESKGIKEALTTTDTTVNK